MLQIINDAEPQSNHRIRLRFADGRAGTIDLSDLIAEGGVFARLADDAAFAQARIGGGGRWVEWPGDIDLCADALYEQLGQSYVKQV